VPHHFHAEGRALVGDLRTEDELERWILDDLFLGFDDLHIGVAFGEGR